MQEEQTVERPRVKLTDWIGVLAHTHSRLTTLSWSEIAGEQGTKILQNWQDGQLPTKVLAEVTTHIGRNGLDLIDSDHAGHSLDAYHPMLSPGLDATVIRESRRLAFANYREATTQLLSQRLDLRRQVIEEMRTQHPEWAERIYTGVEVDILNPDGQLDVNNPVLSRLDVVGASLHGDEWKDSNGGTEPTYEQVLAAYSQVVTNSNVDVLNHFIRELPATIWSNILNRPERLADFDNLFTQMARNNQCLEINLRDCITPGRFEQNQVVFELLKRAKSQGVKFIIGSDFHRIEQYFQETLADGSTQQNITPDERQSLQQVSTDDIFFANRAEAEESERQVDQVLQGIFASAGNGSGLPKNVLRFARPIHRALVQLQSLGISSEDIINGSRERFRQWVDSRR